MAGPDKRSFIATSNLYEHNRLSWILHTTTVAIDNLEPGTNRICQQEVSGGLSPCGIVCCFPCKFFIPSYRPAYRRRTISLSLLLSPSLSLPLSLSLSPYLSSLSPSLSLSLSTSLFSAITLGSHTSVKTTTHEKPEGLTFTSLSFSQPNNYTCPLQHQLNV